MDPMAPLAPMLDNVFVKINSKDNLVIVAKMDSTGFLTVNLANVMKMVAYTIFAIRLMEAVNVFQKLKAKFAINAKLIISTFHLANPAIAMEMGAKITYVTQ